MPSAAFLRLPLFWTGICVLVLSFAGFTKAAHALQDTTAEDAFIGQDAAPEDETTVIYRPDFFARFPNAVTVIDLIRRIPGGQQILDDGGGGGRGFSSGEDRILIDGNRVSGKQNDSESVLARITVDQVAEIQIIRGSSPDIKVSSQNTILNIVLSDEARGGSGSYEALVRESNDGDWDPGGFLSWGDRMGKLEYFLSFEASPRNRRFIRTERFFDETGTEESRLIERAKRNLTIFDFATNLIYRIDTQNEIRLNGSLQLFDNNEPIRGERFNLLAGGMLNPAGQSLRLETSDRPDWEIGGDASLALSDDWSLRLVALRSFDKGDTTAREDFLLEGEFTPDVVNIVDDEQTETIGRASAIWQPNPVHRLEFGSEIAINTNDTRVELQERENGELVDVDIVNATAEVQEIRNESFLIHSWQISQKLSLESALFTEWSEITLDGSEISNEETFFFLRPSADLRYNLTPADLVQFSVRRQVEQLNFSDFAATLNNDDQVIGTNPDLEPSRTWEIEASYERRIQNSRGSLKLTAQHQEISDAIQLIPIDEEALISAVGNVGDARSTSFAFETSFNLSPLGLPDAVLQGSLMYRDTQVTDAFTGEEHSLNNREDLSWSANFRHDIAQWEFAYGADYSGQDEETFWDIDEITTEKGTQDLTLWAEKTLFAGIIGRVELVNVLDNDFGRRRLLFLDGRNEPLTSRELRSTFPGTFFQISLRGTF